MVINTIIPSHIVGELVSDKNGNTNMVNNTPISGEQAISVIITEVTIVIIITNGCINKVDIPVSKPKKSIILPFPRDVLFLLSNNSSEKPKADLKSPLPNTLFFTEFARFILENNSGIDVIVTIIPAQR